MVTKAYIIALRALLPILIVSVGYLGYDYLKSSKPEVASKKSREKVWPVHAVPVNFSDYQPTLRLFGKTNAGREVELRSLVAGEIVKTGVSLKDGAFVKEGDLLVKIDPFDYEGALTEARANLAEANAKVDEFTTQLKQDNESLARAKEQLVLAERDLERAMPLVEKGTVTAQNTDQRRLLVSQRKQTVEQANNAANITRARIAQQKASIDRLNWRVTQAERNLNNTVLRAPFNAYVQSVNAEKGKLVGASDSIVTLLDKNWVEATFTLSDKQYGRILEAEGSIIGREVEIKWFVGDTPLIYAAEIERVKAEIASENGGVTVIARLQQRADASSIRPGAFIEVNVPDRKYTRVFRVNRTALYDNDHIFVVTDGRLDRRDVVLVGSVDKDILIRGKIQKDEKVIITRLSRVGQGVKVKVIPKEQEPIIQAPGTAAKPSKKHAQKKTGDSDSVATEN